MYSPGIGGHVRRATGGGGGSPKRESGERGRSMGGSVTMRGRRSQRPKKPASLIPLSTSPFSPSKKNPPPMFANSLRHGSVPPPPLPTTTDAPQVFAPLLAPLVNLWLWENTRPADIFLTLLARAFSTIPARAPRTNVVGAISLGTAVAGYALYECTSSMSRWRCSRLKRVMAVPSCQVPCPA